MTIYTFVQQEEIWEITGIEKMRSWNQFTGRHTKGIKCQSLCNDSQKEQSTKPMVGRIAQSKTYRGI